MEEENRIMVLLCEDVEGKLYQAFDIRYLDDYKDTTIIHQYVCDSLITTDEEGYLFNGDPLYEGDFLLVDEKLEMSICLPEEFEKLTVLKEISIDAPIVYNIAKEQQEEGCSDEFVYLVPDICATYPESKIRGWTDRDLFVVADDVFLISVEDLGVLPVVPYLFLYEKCTGDEENSTSFINTCAFSDMQFKFSIVNMYNG